MSLPHALSHADCEAKLAAYMTTHAQHGTASYVAKADAFREAYWGKLSGYLQGVAGPSEAATWVCDQGDGTFDHDWERKSDSSGEVDGGPGDRWTWRECRVCGARDDGEKAPITPAESTPEIRAKVHGCKCRSLAKRVLGDGCDECNPELAAEMADAETAKGETPRTDEIIGYCAYQFPATVGHIPLRAKIEALERESADWKRRAKERTKVANELLMERDEWKRRAEAASTSFDDVLKLQREMGEMRAEVESLRAVAIKTLGACERFLLPHG